MWMMKSITSIECTFCHCILIFWINSLHHYELVETVAMWWVNQNDICYNSSFFPFCLFCEWIDISQEKKKIIKWQIRIKVRWTLDFVTKINQAKRKCKIQLYLQIVYSIFICFFCFKINNIFMHDNTHRWDLILCLFVRCSPMICSNIYSLCRNANRR